MTRARIGIAFVCLWLSVTSCGRKPSGDAGVTASQTAAATVEGAKSPAVALRRAPACDLITRAEMAELLGGAIGKLSGESSDSKTSCTWPPADAGSRAQAEVTIEWDHGTEASFQSQLAGAFHGSAIGRQAAHVVPLGDEAAYSLEGVLTVRTGRTLVSVSLPMRPGAEERSIAVARKLFERMGADSTLRTAPTPQKEKVQDRAGQVLDAVNALVAGAAPTAGPKEKEGEDALPAGFVPDGECADTPAQSDPGVADPAALIPLVEGLTLSQTWIPTAGDYEHECLVQITKIDAREISVTRSCPVGASRHMQVDHRRICRSDFANARLYAPGTSQQTPDVMGGTTLFSLSRASFRELKDAGKTSHRFVHYKSGEMRMNLAGALKRENASTYRIIVNNRAVDLPVLELSGTMGADGDIHPHGLVLNDSQFPLLLDFGWNDYTVRFTKISFPEPSQLEASLEKDRRVDVYGIYFDFASDVLRPESEPILKEIAGVLARNVAWTLSINGHTDNIGGDKSNLDLSRRRSEAVRKALTDRYAIAQARLTTSGYGASQPKATNDTIEGRAQNRRVELIRR